MLSALLMGVVVLCLGDSISALDDSWCNRSKHETVNISIGGSTAQRWSGFLVFGRAAPQFKQRRIDVVHVLVGGNDVAAGRSAKDYATDLKNLVGVLKQYGAADIVLSTPGYFKSNLPDLDDRNRTVDAYAKHIERICAGDPAVRCDIDLRKLDATYFDDKLHPTARGSAVIARELDALIGASSRASAKPKPSRGSCADVVDSGGARNDRRAQASGCDATPDS